MKNLVIFTVFSIVIYKGKSNSKWSQYTKFSHPEPRKIFKNFGSLRSCSKPIKTKIKINLYHHKNPGKIERSSESHI